MIQLQCTHKACNKMQSPYIDPKTEKVYCSECENEIQANHFMKVQLKTLKQYRQKDTSRFSTKCALCKKEGTPIILNNDVNCASCKKPLSHLSDIFKNMLKRELAKKEE